MNLKRRGRERQREKHERIRESRVEGGPREKEEGEYETVKQREKSVKRFQVGRDEEAQTKIASQTRQVEREDVDVGWVMYAGGADSPGSLGVQVEICQTL